MNPLPAYAAELAPGARLIHDGGASFRVFAPAQRSMHLQLEASTEPLLMQAQADGWHVLDVSAAGAGDRYWFVVDQRRIPDPASRYQPKDVHGPSEIIDPDAYRWQASGWQGCCWEDVVLYELHIGTFTPQGTFIAAIEKLDHLALLGITAIQVMPVSDFPGTRNWGYDGVLPYATDASYGRPEEFKRFIDAAHTRGIAVLLDVVYNHFGPEGNYLSALVPQLFTQRHHTPWGAAINYDDTGCHFVREFVIQNACYWISEFRLDGLRLDAVHAILDDSQPHLLEVLATRVRAVAADRPVHLLLENERNETTHLKRAADGYPLYFTAQWNDDLHHLLHVAATGECHGYYSKYRGDTSLLAGALAEGFALQGQALGNDLPRGPSSGHLPPSAFVSFMQNHDHIGNRAFGERINSLVTPAAARAIAAVYLLAPQIPMLFMGEEWDARNPFLFFSDFGSDFAAAVRDGRREGFKNFPAFAAEAQHTGIPDPQSPDAFHASKLRWEDLSLPHHATCLEWYRRILNVRRAEITPRLRGITRGGQAQIIAEQTVLIRWDCGGNAHLQLAANLSGATQQFPVDEAPVLWHEGPVPQGPDFAPGTVRWSLMETA